MSKIYKKNFLKLQIINRKRLIRIIIFLLLFTVKGEIVFGFDKSLGLQDTAFVFINSNESNIYLHDFINHEIGNPNLSFSVASRNTSIVNTIEVNYTDGDEIAILRVEENGILGECYVIIEVNDDNQSFIDSVLVSVVNYNSAGIKFEIHDAVFWQQYIPINNVPVFDTVIQTSEGPYDELNWDNIPITVGDDCEGDACTGADFFTTLYKGVLIPPATGDYTFYVKCQSHMGMWISSDDKYENASTIIHSGQSVGEDVGNQEWKSATQTLQEGKPYAFYATQWIIHTKNGGVLWEGPSITKDYIDGQHTMPVYDTEKPAVVQNIELSSIATTSIKLSWLKTTDNIKVSGYRIYINGVLYNTDLIEDIKAEVVDLIPGNNYSITITAVDQLLNESLSSIIVNAKTYNVETIPPTPPTTFTTNVTTGVSAQIRWSGAADNEAVIAYNLYVNDVLYNLTDYILSDSIIVYNLLPNTNYKVNIESIDPSYNISELSKDFNFYFIKVKYISFIKHW